jgi:hypothetical protein
MSQPQDIYVAPLPKKAAPKCSRGHGASLEPGKRSERITTEPGDLVLAMSAKWDWKGSSRSR